MTDTLGEFTQVDDNTQPGKLRELLSQAHALLKQKDQEISTLKTAETQRTVQSTWNELNVPDAIRKLYNGDTSPDAIKSWWEDSKALFNIQAGEQAPTETQPTAEQQAQALAAQQFQQASTLGTDALNTSFDAVTAKVDAAKAIVKAKGRGADFEAARKAAYEAMGTREY